MRNTENGVIGSDQTAVMARLALDELIDQLLHSNALSLKLTANPLVADRAWHLTENTCIRAFSADDPQAKKRAHHALFILYQSWLADPLSPAAANQFHPLLSGIRNYIESEWLRAESKRFHRQRPVLNAGNIVDELRALCQQHPASHHPLFDFLASEGLRGADRLFLQKRQRAESAVLRSCGDGAGRFAAGNPRRDCAKSVG